MKKILYIKGDMFPVLEVMSESELVVVPHVVNNVGRFGSGFAAAVTKHYPKVREDYMNWSTDDVMVNRWGTKAGGRQLGNTQFVLAKQPNLVFANMCGQVGTVSAKNPKPIKYLALANAMEDVAIAYTGTRFGKHFQIIAPMFGAGLACGTWKFIEELIYEIWIEVGIPVTVYHLEDIIS